MSRRFKFLRSRAVVISVVVALVSGSFAVGGSVAFAKASDTIDLLKKNIDNAKKEIAEYRERLYGYGKSKQTLKGELSLIEKEIELLEKDIRLNTMELEVAERELSESQRDILELSLLSDRVGALRARSLAEINKISLTDGHPLEKSFLPSAIFHRNERMKLLSVMQDDLKERADTFRRLRLELEDIYAKTEKEKEEIEKIKNNISYKKKILQEQKNNKKELVRITEEREATYRKLIKDKRALIKALEDEIYLYESKLKYDIDITKLPARGSKILSWPLDKILITQKFGKTKDSVRLYLSGTHSGVDFRAPVGTPVYAMADGVVAGVGDTDTQCPKASFGKWVFIKYDNRLASTFGHLSGYAVSPGDRVKKGDIVAYSGNTGRSFGPHLHVTVYAGVDARGESPVEVRNKPSRACEGATLTQPLAPTAAYLDPLDYLPKTKKSMFK